MPVLKLGPVVVAPEPLLVDAVRAVAPNASLAAFGERGLRAAFDADRLVAAIHPTAGESRVFPALEALRPGPCAEHARAFAEKLLRERELFPADETDVVALEPTVLVGSTHERGSESVSGECLAYVRFQRRIGGARVFGPGTRAMIAVAADGSLRAFAHRWRVAKAADRRVEPHPRERVAEAIRDQLAGVSKTADVRLANVTVAYYDAGGEFLQPVYRFQATVDPPPASDSGGSGATRRFCGYVSIGIAPEPLPVIGAKPGPSPAHPTAGVSPRPQVPGDPTVGRYVVRNDSDEWVASANEFLGGLKEAEDFFGGPIPFTDAQYYWAQPWEFTSNKDDFVNSVHIALNEVHGNWGWFSTRDNNDDGVSLSDIPAGGYGGRDGDTLAYWIIHSCEVIPTATDEPTSFDVWWNIFNGLHAVVGYRTEMWIDDDVTGQFGLWIGLGAPVVSAWLGEVASNDSYDDGDTYHDGNRNMDEPMGRASAIAVSGHGDDIASNIGSLGRAGSLTEWWFDN